MEQVKAIMDVDEAFTILDTQDFDEIQIG